MKLLTDDFRAVVPRTPDINKRATNDMKDPMIVAKFFQPWGGWTWYVIDWDGEDVCFGLVDGFEVELGSFSISELQSAPGPFGLTIERDLHWTPAPLSEVQKRCLNRRQPKYY